uniref:ZP domain-containing protein n=1 Tax=Angiostrongylus cantonensis TaxID=6313 RepID=A0A0K0DQJ4_ANGCA
MEENREQFKIERLAPVTSAHSIKVCFNHIRTSVAFSFLDSQHIFISSSSSLNPAIQDPDMSEFYSRGPPFYKTKSPPPLYISRKGTFTSSSRQFKFPSIVVVISEQFVVNIFLCVVKADSIRMSKRPIDSNHSTFTILMYFFGDDYVTIDKGGVQHCG